ncbi:Mannosylfructose-phosphate synthase [compost metagenome]
MTANSAGFRRADGRLRVALLCPEPVEGPTGGIGTYSATLARGLTSLGHRVHLVAPRGDLPAGIEAKGELSLHRLELDPPVRLPFGNRFWGLTLACLPWIREAARAVRRIHDTHPLDLVEVPEWMGGALRLPHGLPIVVRHHTHAALVRRLNERPESLDQRLRAALEGLAMRRGDLRLANSRALAEACSLDHRLPLSKIGVLRLGVDLERFRPGLPPSLRDALGIPSDHVVMGYVGRLERRKGIDILAEAFARLAPRLPYLHLLLAGGDTQTLDGSAWDAVSCLAAEAGVQDRLHWLGSLPTERLPEIYAASDVLVAPSRMEPFGMVYLEAMASGLPVIGTLAGGVPEIVMSERHGYLVLPGSVESLMVAMMALATDEGRRRRMGREARRHVETTFDQRRIARLTVEAYQEAIRRRTGKEAGYGALAP